MLKIPFLLPLVLSVCLALAPAPGSAAENSLQGNVTRTNAALQDFTSSATLFCVAAGMCALSTLATGADKIGTAALIALPLTGLNAYFQFQRLLLAWQQTKGALASTQWNNLKFRIEEAVNQLPRELRDAALAAYIPEFVLNTVSEEEEIFHVVFRLLYFARETAEGTKAMKAYLTSPVGTSWSIKFAQITSELESLIVEITGFAQFQKECRALLEISPLH